MTTFQYSNLKLSALLQISWRSALLLVLVCSLTLVTSCSNDDIPVFEPIVRGQIVLYNDYNGAMLDITEADMKESGFTLGDLISVTIDDKKIVMPYYDGYYAPNGEYLLVAYPTYPSICFTANNTGLPQELMGLEGHTIIIKMKEKGGSLDVQKALGMTYTNNRSDYPTLSDEEYANARVVTVGNIPTGILYRSSSPFNNKNNRAYYVSEYLEREGVKTVLNLADTVAKMQTYDIPPYSRTLWDGGYTIFCPLRSDPTAEDYNTQLIEALKQLPSYPAPYVVHCLEGKDRTGYVCALLEGLCGATYDEIVADYLVTYNNFYHITPEKDYDICKALLSLKLHLCLMYYTGVYEEAQLPTVDYVEAFSNYLLSHGMSQQQLDALVQALTERRI